MAARGVASVSQNTQGNTNPKAVNPSGTAPVLSKADQRKVDSISDPDDKVKYIKSRLGIAGTAAYAHSIGVSWKPSAHAGIDNMRMSMALVRFFGQSSGTTDSAVAKPTKPSNKTSGKSHSNGSST